MVDIRRNHTRTVRHSWRAIGVHCILVAGSLRVMMSFYVYVLIFRFSRNIFNSVVTEMGMFYVIVANPYMTIYVIKSCFVIATLLYVAR